jgi:chemotaxis signal transduction protein
MIISFSINNIQNIIDLKQVLTFQRIKTNEIFTEERNQIVITADAEVVLLTLIDAIKVMLNFLFPDQNMKQWNKILPQTSNGSLKTTKRLETYINDLNLT